MFGFWGSEWKGRIGEQPQPGKCRYCLGNCQLFKVTRIMNVADKQIGYDESQTIKCEHCNGTGSDGSFEIFK